MADETHVVQLGTQYNEIERAYDVVLMVGNFGSREEAVDYAHGLAVHLKKWRPIRSLLRQQ